MHQRTRLLGGLLGVALANSPLAAQGPRPEFAADRAPTVVVLPTTRLTSSPPSYALDDLVRLGLARNPRLAQAGFAADAARGRAVQAGLYPNPTLAFTGDELGDRQGRAGILTLPQVSQEIVTGGKLTLGRAVADREADQATLALVARRAELMAAIRAAYFDALALDRRVTILRELRALTQQSVGQARRRVEAKQAAQLDVVQLEVEAERVRADADAAEQELPAAFLRLAAVVGEKDLPPGPLTGSLDGPLPPYDLDRVRAHVLAVHPDVRAARLAGERARLALQRAKADAIPNVTVSAGYVRQNQNKSDDFMLGVSLPLPVWNRNQGAVQAAEAHVGEAAREVERVENDLTDRVATAYRDFAAARTKAERLEGVRAKADEAFRLIAGNDFTFTTVQRLVAQQAVTQARLEAAKALSDAWRAASALSGLTLEEAWPRGPDEKR